MDHHKKLMVYFILKKWVPEIWVTICLGSLPNSIPMVVYSSGMICGYTDTDMQNMVILAIQGR